jgi:hypothetical protein
MLAAHESLDGEDRAVRVGHALPLGNLPNETLAFLGEGHHGRGCSSTFLIHDDSGLTALHHRHNRVRRTEVDSDDLAHLLISPTRRIRKT